MIARLGRSIGWFGRLMVRRLVVFWILGFTFIGHISNISTISIDVVSDSLFTAIRKKDVVVSVGSIAIASFFSSKMKRSIVILN